MDVVAEAGAVVGGIIIAEDIELRKFVAGDFHDVGHEVIRYTIGVFAEQTGLVITDGIEIAKSDDMKLRVGDGEIL